MIDQAEKLRKIMNNKEVNEVCDDKKAKVISVSSGKGGVGKTNFSLNFAISLKKLGYRVVVMDADIGLSNIEILAGINANSTISDIIFSDKTIYDIMTEGPEGVKVISGGSGLKELSLLMDENFPKLIQEIEMLQSSTDFIIIDTGAGISNAVTDFIMTSSEVIVICTPDPTSLMDSYTLIKSIVSSGFTGKINLVCNLVNNKNEGKEIYNKINNASNNFLRVQIHYLGYIEKDNLVNYAVRNQMPFVISHPNSSISKRMNIITTEYLGKETAMAEENKISFAKRILDVFLKRGD